MERTIVGTAGNISDVTQAHALLHGDARLPRREEVPRKCWESGYTACGHEALQT
jgi:hypothetical protein